MNVPCDFKKVVEVTPPWSQKLCSMVFKIMPFVTLKSFMRSIEVFILYKHNNSIFGVKGPFLFLHL